MSFQFLLIDMNDIRPTATIAATEARTCYLCGGDGDGLYAGLRDPWLGTAGTWALRSCRQCELAWLDPRPRPEELGKLYGEGYYTHGGAADSGERPAGRLRRIVREAILAPRPAGSMAGAAQPPVKRRLARALWAIRPLREVAAGSVMWLQDMPPGRLLDVGCGDGLFLSRMRDRSWEVTGVEPDPVAADVARTRYGLEIIGSPLEEVGLPAESFDVVTMSHVIEHVLDPVEVLDRCRRVLRPGGRLVVVTPNLRSLGRFWFRSRWMGWDIPRHMFVFSPRGLARCADRAGLRLRGMRTTARSSFAAVPSIRVLREADHSRRGLRRAGAILFWLAEDLVHGIRPCGEEILMMAERPPNGASRGSKRESGRLLPWR